MSLDFSGVLSSIPAMLRCVALLCVLAIITPMLPCADLCRAAWQDWAAAAQSKDTCDPCCSPAPATPQDLDACGEYCLSAEDHQSTTPLLSALDLGHSLRPAQLIALLHSPIRQDLPAWLSWRATPRAQLPHCLLI